MTLFMSVLLGMVSMVTYSLANVYSQPIVRKIGSTQVLFLRGLVITGILAIACIPSYHQLQDPLQALLTLLLGIAGYVPVLAFMHGLRVSRVGIVAPIGATSALVTVVLAAVFLAAPLSWLQWLAIVIVIAANVAISVNPKDIKSSNVMQFASGVPYALIAAVGWGLFYFLLVYPTRDMGPWMSALLVEAGVTVAAGLHLYQSQQTFKLKDIKSPILVGSGVCIVIGTVTYTIGVYSYNVGIVAVLSNSTALVSALLAAWLFKERLNNFEKIVAAVMIAGVILVSLP
jgi:drug/metabolite transporter (DMT)-like permease